MDGNRNHRMSFYAVLLLLPAIFILAVWGAYTVSAWLAVVAVLSCLCLFFAVTLLRLYGRMLKGSFGLERSLFDRHLFVPARLLAALSGSGGETSGERSLETKLREQEELNRELTVINERMEALLKERTAALTQADNARRQLLANLSHDLRTPLTSIRGYVEAMLDGIVTEPAERTKYLNLIYTRVLTLNRLITELFELTRLEARQIPVHLREVPVHELIARVYDRYDEDVRMAGLELQAALPAPDARVGMAVRVDEELLDRVFGNLIANSIRHTPAGGTIAIGVDPERGGRSFTLIVQDSGEGLAPESVTHIFDRYYQGAHAASKNGAAGLGLSIAKEIVSIHGGEIWAESRPQTGMTVYISLPAVELPPAAGHLQAS